MKKHSIIKVVSFVLVICFTNLSCFATYYKSKSSDSQRYYSNINSTSKRYDGTVYLINGESFDVENIVVTPDSTTWIDSNTSNKISVKTSDINKFEFKNHLIGGIGGFVIGFLVGLTLGYVGDIISEGEASYGILGGVLLGSGLGLLIGGGLGDRKEYIIVPMDRE